MPLSIDQQVKKYKDDIVRLENTSSQYEKELKERQLSLKQHILDYKDCNMLMKILRFFSYSLRTQALQEEIEVLEEQLSQQLVSKNTSLKVLVVEVALDLIAKSEHAITFKALESEYVLLKELYLITSKAERSGQLAIEEIRKAVESLSDAESIEVIDAVTDNKFISAVSTVQNFSASDATRQASKALTDFQQKLSNQQVYWKEISHSPIIEAMDFAIDMVGVSRSLDFIGSLFSLISLSNTKDKLSDLLEQLTPTVKKLTDKCAEQEAKLKKNEKRQIAFKVLGCEKVIPILQSHGITVSQDFVSSIAELYVPSADN